jgi:SAM-dependent methyltransferase
MKTKYKKTDSDSANASYHEAQDKMALLPNYYKWICKTFSKKINGIVLDIGCGEGHITPFYAEKAKKVIAVDYNEVLLDRLAKKEFNTVVSTVKSDLRGDWDEIPDASSDCALALDVMEHFEDDKEFARKLRKKMKKGGWAAIKVPAQSRLFGEMDKASGHYRRYDPDGFEKMMKEAGWDVVQIRSINPIGSFIYKYRNNQKSNFSKSFPEWQLKGINHAISFIRYLDLLGLPGLSLVGIFENNKSETKENS